MEDAAQKNEKIESFLKSCVSQKLFPGSVYLIGENGRIIAQGAVGHAVVEPVMIEMHRDTIFDVASLTKPLCTALLAVLLAGNRVFNLNDRIGKFLPVFREGGKQDIAILHLLTHTSGFPRWLPLYLHGADFESQLQYLAAQALRFRPGRRVLYGCPAYIVMSAIIRKIAGEGIDRLFRELVSVPLGLQGTGFNPPAGKRRRIAASEKGNRFERKLAGGEAKRYDGFREKMIWGSVHDHNSFALGGIGGNAGLFSNAKEMFKLSQEFMGTGKGILGGAERRLFHKNFTEGLNEGRSIGWQIASTRGCSAGRYIPGSSIGHTGFTGASMWIDTENMRTYILLTNRTHPVYREFNMNAARRRFHRLASTLKERCSCIP